MKKFLCLAVFFCAPALQASSEHRHSFTGFYLTGAVGATSAKVEVTPNYAVETPFTFSFDSSMDPSATSAAGLIGLTYLYEFANHFVLGGEFSAGYTRAQAAVNPAFDETLQNQPGNGAIDVGYEVESTLTNDFALVFKPGYASGHHTLYYGLIGARWGNFKSSTQAGVNLLFPPTHFTGEGDDTVSGYQLGFTVGAGIAQQITERLLLSLEYAYTDYGTIDSPSATFDLAFDGTPTRFDLLDAPKLEASTNTLLLGLSYQW